MISVLLPLHDMRRRKMSNLYPAYPFIPLNSESFLLCKQVRRSGIPISFIIFFQGKGFKMLLSTRCWAIQY